MDAEKNGEITLKLKTDRLLLRDYTPEDWESVHVYGKDPEFSKYEPWGPNSVEDTKNFIADNIMKSKLNPRFHYELAVCLKEGSRQIGGCGLRRESQTSEVANMGWAINPEFQKRGYATEAASKLIQFGFEDLNLRVIYATCDTRNVASYKVMEKIGMKRVGHLIANRNFKNEVSDSYRYEITI